MQPNGSAAPGVGTPGEAVAEQLISDAEVDAKVVYLAGLPDLTYGRQRKEAAANIGLSVAWLDKLVRTKKAEFVAQAGGNGEGDSGGQGRAINLPAPEPWPHAVDGAELLSAITKAVLRHMVMEDGAAESVALWAVHTHALDAFGITPRLSITSPRPQCGKTTLLDILYRLVVRPLLAGNVSAASVFRVVEVAQPTLLVDEADTFLPGNDELRGVMNSGHRRGGSVIRVVGEAMEVREFSTFAPAAIAMIGHLPGTLADRSVPIMLKRKRADEPVESFRYDRTQELDQLARMCARWAADNIGRLRIADPEVPPNLYNRAADNWRPLLAIADAAGGEWPARTRGIAANTVDADQVKRIGLLADIREVFETRKVDRIKSADLAATLVAMEGHSWAEFGKSGKPLSANSLARMLANDSISPNTLRWGEETAKGYERAQFEDAFARYLPSPQIPTVTPSQPADSLGFPADSQPSQPEPCYGLEIAQNPSVSAACDGVTVGKPDDARKSERVRVRL
jgi:putative DNA primase/helicase